MATASDTAALWSSVSMCGLMTLVSIYAFFYVQRFSKFRWVQFMLFLCIIQNANSVALAIGVYWEVTPFHQEHEPFLAYFMGVTIFLFYFVSTLIYWLFGFKYWVISIEIPYVLQQEENTGKLCTETKYNLINWTGILVNFGCCFVCAVVRGQVDYQSTYGPAPEQLG